METFARWKRLRRRDASRFRGVFAASALHVNREGAVIVGEDSDRKSAMRLPVFDGGRRLGSIGASRLLRRGGVRRVVGVHGQGALGALGRSPPVCREAHFLFVFFLGF